MKSGFFFDVEVKDKENWDERLKIINKLRRLKKNPNIKVRLLMTTGCIEYWLMLHYKKFTPSVLTVADKEKMLAEVVAKEPSYVKGDYESTTRIAKNYPVAVKNAEDILQSLIHEGLPCLEDTDERNKWLCTECKTFSTVNEAITFLEQLYC
ncbi:MAG: RloB domain-containing protein [Erysipelotrichaceae bacterium]